MAKQHKNLCSNLLLLLATLVLQTLPAQAQEAAFEMPASAQGQGRASAAPTQPRPQPAMAGTESNLKHWSRFSQSSASPFVRVPAGARCARANVSHYVRPQRVEPGSVPAYPQSPKGPVKRYLAFSVPAGSAVHKSAPPVANTTKRAHKRQSMVLGYGRKGEVTYTPVQGSHWTGTAVSCYGRYH